MPTQLEMYNKAHRVTNDSLQFAYWMLGKMPDSSGEWNDNPLTLDEARSIASGSNSSASIYRYILERIDANT